jgi:RNA polymerase sigma-70 factor, ECF subfamily
MEDIMEQKVRSDKELVESLKTGDCTSFDELLKRYSEKVHNLAMRITRNEEDAEEILQDVFVTVHKKIDKFEGKSAFSSWLYRVTANTAFMKLRKRRQTPSVSLEDFGAGVKESWVSKRSEDCDVDYISSRHELRGELEEAIEKLPEEYRAIFLLRDVDGLSSQEVGEILNISVPAVKSRLHRSRLMLRKKLQKYYDEYSSTPSVPYGNGFAVPSRYLHAA